MVQTEDTLNDVHIEVKGKSGELSDNASSSSSDSYQRTGTVWSAVAHLINGVIGSGVLSLAWSVAQLGWIAGPLCIAIFGMITIISSNLICDCYRYPHPETGHIRNRSYAKAVGSYLGKKSMWVIGVFIYESFYGFSIAFTITTAHSIRALLKSNCFHKKGHSAPCEYGDTKYMLWYGGIQLLLSQIPDLHAADILSMFAAVMSFGYATIGMGLGLANTISNGYIKGTISPPLNNPRQAWLSFQAIGDIAFSFTYNIIILDIQDTIKEPQENRKMKKAVNIGVSVVSFFFLCCGCFGYAASGHNAPGNLLTDFGFYEPYWLLDLANACVILHLIGGYALYSQPLFAAVERKLKKLHPESKFVNKEYEFKLPLLPRLRLNLLRLCFRTAYVVTTTAIAATFPYFNEVLGVLGALNFWPVMIYFPVQMYLKQNEVTSWTPKWIFLQVLKVFGLLVSILALLGSLEGIIHSKFG